MPTQLPYAADAEESLAFDELEVSTIASVICSADGTETTGLEEPVRKGTGAEACVDTDKVQLWYVIHIPDEQR
jgi:hypothetical protein